MHARMCIYIYIYVCVCICLLARMCAQVCVCVRVCECACAVCPSVSLLSLPACLPARLSVHVCATICVSVHLYVHPAVCLSSLVVYLPYFSSISGTTQKISFRLPVVWAKKPNAVRHLPRTPNGFLNRRCVSNLVNNIGEEKAMMCRLSSCGTRV